MKTEELVTLLATGAGAVERDSTARRFGIAVTAGLFVAGVLMMATLGLRSDLLAGIPPDPMFWLKIAFAGLSAVASVVAASRLSRPGAKLSAMPAAIAAPFIAIWLLAAYALIAASPGTRAELVLGESWRTCPLGIAFLSIPVMFSVLWAMKGLAPTRLRLAGLAAGLAAGTLGTLVYALHCPEVAAPFIGTWYVLGMLIPTSVGALIGPRVLRW